MLTLQELIGFAIFTAFAAAIVALEWWLNTP